MISDNKVLPGVKGCNYYPIPAILPLVTKE